MTLPSTPTIPLPEAAELLGIGKSTAYAAVRKGNFPVRVIQIGSRYVVPTKPLLELLDLEGGCSLVPDYQSLESLNLLEPPARPAHDNDQEP